MMGRGVDVSGNAELARAYTRAIIHLVVGGRHEACREVAAEYRSAGRLGLPGGVAGLPAERRWPR